MDPRFEQEKFNDDLLIHVVDRELANRKYPALMHLLDYPHLRRVFVRHSSRADQAKRAARRSGSIAIAAACLALFGASVEPAIHAANPAYCGLRLAPTIAAVSSFAGIVSLLVGSFGAMFGERKRAWLHHRMMTERLRQFHFQAFLSYVSLLLKSDEASVREFGALRDRMFEAFLERYEAKAMTAFAACTSDDSDDEVWLIQPDMDINAQPSSDLLFQAYRELRISHQLSYAKYKLERRERFISEAPVDQAVLLTNASMICVAAICTVHVGILASVLTGASLLAGLQTSIAPIVVIWIAIVALATHAFEQGLQPQREIERYQRYAAACKSILRRFDDARSTDIKLAIMREMERLAFDEMRSFLTDNKKARFVL